MPTQFLNATLLHPAPMERTSFTVTDGRFTGFNQAPHAEDIQVDLDGQFVIPGLFDAQVNGVGGIMFNDNPSLDTIRHMSAVLATLGTTSFLPTLVSDDLEKVKLAIEAVASAIALKVPGVRGIHLEGPFLNSQKKGVHNAQKFRKLDDNSIDLISTLTNGKTLITLAPELTSPQLIAELVRRGIIVAAGHTMANFTQTQIALKAGLTGFTHLFNAMPQIESRNPGCIVAALESKNSFCSLIVDGHHVDPALLRMALRAKSGNQGMFLVSDAISSVGTDKKELQLAGQKLFIKNGKCTTAEGTLAGAHLSLWEAVQNAAKLLNIEFATAVEMATATPAGFMHLDKEIGRITADLCADFLVLDQQKNLRQTWVAGQCVHDSLKN